MSAPAPAKPALPIDPRIRARRVEVIRTEGRRRLRLLVAGLSVLLVLGGGVGVTRSPLLDVDQVKLSGAARTTRSQVLAASGLAGSPQMVDIDPARVASRVRALPWVRTARVERRWPGVVSISLTERRPVLAVSVGRRWALVDATGRVLATQADPAPALIKVTGVAQPGPAGTQVAGALAAVASLAAELPATVLPLASQVVIADGGIELHSAPTSPVVRLGPPTDLEQKIRSVEAVLAGADMRRVTVIDVRVPSAPVLTRR